jgi:hypothetical protein
MLLQASGMGVVDVYTQGSSDDSDRGDSVELTMA